MTLAPRLQVRVVALLELLLQLFQLIRRKTGSAPSELRPVVVGVGTSGVGFGVEIDGSARTYRSGVRRGLVAVLENFFLCY
jgi:hypothetical protein